MFIKNNDMVDFEALEERLSFETAKLARQPVQTTLRTAVSEDSYPASRSSPTAPLEIAMKPEKKRRRLLQKVAAWFKSFLKLYRVADQAALGAQAALSVSDLELRLRALDARIDDRFVTGERAWDDRFAAGERAWDDRIAAGERALDERLATLAQHIDDHSAALEQRFAAVGERFTALEQRLSDCEQRFEDSEEDRGEHARRLQETWDKLGDLRREIMFQQRRLTLMALSARGTEPPETAARVANERLDSFYVAFQEVFRGAREDIKNRLARYVEIVRDAGAGQLGKPVLDVGCGRGEWLELLKENRVLAYGVDVNSVMVERTAALGLDARCVDVLEHLSGLPDAALSALTAFHVIEHVSLDVLIDFLDEALRALAPGGVLILETPNPETTKVGATTFYNDPTHRNPIPPQVLQFMVEHRGFQVFEVLRLHPFTDGLLHEPTADVELLNRQLFGSQDYAVIARRL
jgi:O-antigen chain-terminating methyltransferase